MSYTPINTCRPRHRDWFDINDRGQKKPRAILSSLEDIRADAKKILALPDIESLPRKMRVYTGEEEGTITLSEVIFDQPELPSICEYVQLSEFFTIPEDLLEPCISCLLWLDDMVSDATEKLLHGRVTPLVMEESKLEKKVQLRLQLALLLTHPSVKRPAKAALYLRVCLDKYAALCEQGGKAFKPWESYPKLYFAYGEALMHFNLQGARVAFETVLEELNTSEEVFSDYQMRVCFRAHSNLAWILVELGSGRSECKSHINWATKCLKKNSDLLDENRCREVLTRPGLGIHPVIEKLGGENLLNEDVRSPVRRLKSCVTCNGREPHVTLFMCGSCRRSGFRYCSKKCQRANWKAHKRNCRESAEMWHVVDSLRLHNPQAALFEEAWIRWQWDFPLTRKITVAAFNAFQLHLGLGRTRTHMMVLWTEYTPEFMHWRDKFTVSRAGVFNIEDSLPFVEEVMGFRRGEGRVSVDRARRNYQATNPMLDAALGLCLWLGWNGFTVTAGLGCLAMRTEELEHMENIPDWRKSINEERPPTQLNMTGLPEPEND